MTAIRFTLISAPTIKYGAQNNILFMTFKRFFRCWFWLQSLGCCGLVALGVRRIFCEMMTSTAVPFDMWLVTYYVIGLWMWKSRLKNPCRLTRAPNMWRARMHTAVLATELQINLLINMKCAETEIGIWQNARPKIQEMISTYLVVKWAAP